MNGRLKKIDMTARLEQIKKGLGRACLGILNGMIDKEVQHNAF